MSCAARAAPRGTKRTGNSGQDGWTARPRGQQWRDGRRGGGRWQAGTVEGGNLRRWRMRGSTRQDNARRRQGHAQRTELAVRHGVVMRGRRRAVRRRGGVADDSGPVQRQRDFRPRHHGAEGKLRHQRQQGEEQTGRGDAGHMLHLSRFAGEVKTRSVEGEGDRVAPQQSHSSVPTRSPLPSTLRVSRRSASRLNPAKRGRGFLFSGTAV